MTPDEQRQRLIVRQNALGHATKLLCRQLVIDEELRKQDDDTLTAKLLINAKKFENWVFNEQLNETKEFKRM